MGLGLVTPQERSELIGAFGVYVTPELLQLKSTCDLSAYGVRLAT